jgi:2'-5' RNA ligase
MPIKTHKTSLVAIPPEEACSPIQTVRKQYDRQFRRWMPHITLLYPFRPRDEFERLAGLLKDALRDFKPFPVELRTFEFFRHRGGNCTLWLCPEPREALESLQSALLNIAPDCDDVLRMSGSYVPHLSVGQARSEKDTLLLLNQFQANWSPIRFVLDSVYMIWRNDPPDDAFRVGTRCELGSH